jgi:hypothetical protein
VRYRVRGEVTHKALKQILHRCREGPGAGAVAVGEQARDRVGGVYVP